MKKQILLIDDDPDIRSQLSLIIGTAGYDFLAAKDGYEGLEKISKHHPDLIIIDHKMPGMSGEALFDRIREERVCDDEDSTPVMMLTGSPRSHSTVRKLLQRGLNAYLRKPFGARELLNVIDNVMVQHGIHTNNEKTRRRLEDSRNFLESLLENCPMLIMTTDRDGKIAFVNHQTTELFGYEKKEIEGANVWQIFPTSRPRFKHMLDNPETAAPTETLEYNAVNNSGADIPISIMSSTLWDEQNVFQGLLLVCQDLTIQKELDKERLSKERLTAINESFVTINHQINNPLTPILGNIELIRKHDFDLDDVQKRRLEIIEINARKISNIVRKFSRISDPGTKSYYGGTKMLEI